MNPHAAFSPPRFLCCENINESFVIPPSDRRTHNYMIIQQKSQIAPVFFELKGKTACQLTQ